MTVMAETLMTQLNEINDSEGSGNEAKKWRNDSNGGNLLAQWQWHPK